MPIPVCICIKITVTGIYLNRCLKRGEVSQEFGGGSSQPVRLATCSLEEAQLNISVDHDLLV